MERGRWDALFADLEGELAGEHARDLDAEVRDRTRREHARLSLADRLRAHRGTAITVGVRGGAAVSGRLADADRDWLLVGETLVLRLAVRTVTGLGPEATDPDTTTMTRPIGYALRAMAGPVTCTFTDGGTLTGRIGRVGKDHVDVDGTTVPFRALATVRPV